MTSIDRKTSGPGRAAPRALVLALPLLVLVVAEGALRVVAPPAPEAADPYLGFSGLSPLFVPDPEDRAALSTAPAKRRWFNEQSFPRVKGERTTRIFCLGGSTVYGHPYDAAVAFPRGLELILDHAEPGVRHQVLNCGGISYASYRLTHIAAEIAAYEPDAVVILTGHNEFLERRSYPDLAAGGSGSARVRGLLGRMRLYGLLREGLLALRDRPEGDLGARDRLGGEVVAMLDRSAGLDLYHRDPPFRAQVLAHFEHNLRVLVDTARGCGAALVLVTPAANLADFSPFKSEHGGGLSAAAAADCEAALARAGEALEAGRPEQALAQLDAVDDPGYAELHYLRGRALRALGRLEAAGAAFGRAREEDVAPLRAPAAFVAAARRVAAELRVPLVDPVAALADSARRATGLESPGSRYFLDHVHPRPEIHRAIAEGVAAELVGAGLVRPAAPDWSPAAARPAYRRRILDAIDPVRAARCDLNLAKTLSWAGKQAEARPFALSAAAVLAQDADAQYTAGVAQMFAGEDAEALFRGALALDPGHARARSNLGALLAGRGETDAAKAELRRAARDDSSYVSPLLSLASLLSRQGRKREAIEALREAQRRDPTDPAVRGGLGALYLELGLTERALSELRQAARRAPRDAAIQSNLGLALAAAERHDEALQAYRRALDLGGEDARMLVNYAIALERSGDRARAREVLERARALRPDDPVIERLAGEWW